MKVTVYAPGKANDSDVINLKVARGVKAQDLDKKTRESFVARIEKHFEQRLKGAWYKTVDFGEGSYVGPDQHERMRDELELVEVKIGDRKIYTDDEDALKALFGVAEVEAATEE